MLYQLRNRIKVGQLYYTLAFENFSDQEYARCQMGRDSLFQQLGYPKPHAALSAVPWYQDAKKGLAVTHRTISQGTFSWVSTVVDARNG